MEELSQKEKQPGRKQKTVITIVSSLLVLAVFVGFTVYFMQKRKYSSVAGTDVTQTENTTEKTVSHQESDSGITVTSTITLPENLDAYRYVKQGYELTVLFGVNGFTTPAEISINQLVQYAFCYLYSDARCLTDYCAGAMTYREASVEQIRTQIITLFGTCPNGLCDADLYNQAHDTFEMWQPNYQTQLYADATVSAQGEDIFQIIATYYTDSNKAEKKATKILTLKKNENGYYLAALR